MPPKRKRRATSRKNASTDEIVNVQPVVSIPDIDIFTRKELQTQYQSFTEERILPSSKLC